MRKEESNAYLRCRQVLAKTTTRNPSTLLFLGAKYYMKMLTSLTVLMVWAALGVSAEITVRDGDINAGQEVRWTSNNTYILDGLVYVEQGAKLYIEPGTVIKGKETPSTGDNTSALIVTRGAQIFAIGTATQPIIFTAEADSVADPADLDFTDRARPVGRIDHSGQCQHQHDGRHRPHRGDFEHGAARHLRRRRHAE
jgi:hypothetical protein